ncbi:MAG: copper chaperone PCu(A)C, partial [Janthinobacterium lividum]
MNKKILTFSFLSLFCYVNLSVANITNVSTATSSQTDVLQQSQSAKQDEKMSSKILEFRGAWARPSLSPNKNSAIYLKIKNNSANSYTLVRASTIAANRTELHQSYVDENKVSKMVTINKIVIPAKSEIELKPGGMHIMLF